MKKLLRALLLAALCLALSCAALADGGEAVVNEDEIGEIVTIEDEPVPVEADATPPTGEASLLPLLALAAVAALGAASLAPRRLPSAPGGR